MRLFSWTANHNRLIQSRCPRISSTKTNQTATNDPQPIIIEHSKPRPSGRKFPLLITCSCLTQPHFFFFFTVISFSILTQITNHPNFSIFIAVLLSDEAHKASRTSWPISGRARDLRRWRLQCNSKGCDYR